MGVIPGDLPVVIAVDGGATKTEILAVALDGTIIGRAIGTGSNAQRIGWDSAIGVLDGLRAEILETIGERPVIRTHVYLAGLDLPEEFTTARVRLAHWGPGGPELLDNDLFALLRAGTLSLDAAAVICGTGMNAIAVRADGATARFDAIGEISGDWGGGSWLGSRALWHAARALDGRGPATVLENAVSEALGTANLVDAIHAIHLGHIPREAITALAPVLIRAAERGDEPAQCTVRRQAEEIVIMATTALRRLDLLATPLPIVLGGGVLASRSPALLGPITEGFARHAPLAEVVWVTAPPSVGAALAALDAVGAADSALQKLQKAYGVVPTM